ncbi:tyrosine-type recombinase/integrase [Acidobacteriota bacterium]
MNERFRPDHEICLIERFTKTMAKANKTRANVVCFCCSFRVAFPNQTPLNYMGCTSWFAPWWHHAVKQYSVATLYEHLKAFSRFTQWLFREAIIDDNVFAHVRVWHLLQGKEPLLSLRYNLHRFIERHVAEAYQDSTTKYRTLIRSTLLDFNAFLNRWLDEPPPDAGTLSIDVPLITAWLCHRHTRVQQTRDVVLQAARVHRFLEFAKKEGGIAKHAFADLLRHYGRRGFKGIVKALMAADPQKALASARSEPRFASILAEEFRAFAAYKRSLGQDFRVQDTILAHVDRYLRMLPPSEQRLSLPLLEQWLSTTPTIGSNARRRRWLLVRQFCQWMTVTNPSFFVPDPLDIPRRTPSRRPFIYTVHNIQQLLHTASELPPPGSLRSHTYRCLIVLLYGAGLRISEALALNVEDFDSEQQLLLIRKTKFHKSRYVPLAPSVSVAIDSYLQIRRQAGHCLPSDEPIFVTKRCRRCVYSTFISTFLYLLRRCGLRGPPGETGPRIHDLRHTTAVHRLTRWYEEGVDVQAKLPLLSTYLGHGSVAATQVYLTITAELLRHGAARFHSGRGCSAILQEVSDEQ